MMLTTPPPAPRLLRGFPGSTRFLARPQLLTRHAPLSLERDIPRTTSTRDHPCAPAVAPLHCRYAEALS
jgi:hypothetical protein